VNELEQLKADNEELRAALMVALRFIPTTYEAGAYSYRMVADVLVKTNRGKWKVVREQGS
jgi:hypothetical protein